MRPVVLPLLVLGAALALLLFVYHAVLFQGEQFAFRDVGHFYYPLYERVQEEWRAGRWPLWNPWENGGQPLLGSPMSAVLYPGKLIYVPFSYAWGARLYVVGHTVLAFVGMLALARSLGLSWVGAGLSGLSYAFGAPVLFQYCNVIYLVGAAWMPWGLRAAERLVRLHRPWALAELAIVLAMQVHGGDPQAAFLTVLCAAAYAVLVTLRARTVRRFAALWLTLGLIGAWIALVLAQAWGRIAIPGWIGPVWVPALLGWMATAGWVVLRWRRGRDDGLGGRLAALAGATVLGLALAAAPLVTAAEYLAAGTRTGDRLPTNRSKFSNEPYRLVELVWPWAFGEPFPQHKSWIQLIPPEADRELWVPSLYVGGLTLVLGLGAAGFREEPRWRPWLTAVAAVGLLASLGKFASPLWWFRWLDAFAAVLGPHDPLLAAPRIDAALPDAVGSPYELLSALLPGFGLFRYPAKLFTLTAAGLSALAGLGWDELAAGRAKRLIRIFLFALVASALTLVLASAFSGRAVAFLTARSFTLIDTGPLDPGSAWRGTQRALAHGLIVYAIGLVLAIWGPRRPLWAGALVLAVLAADLGVANGRMIWTVPQSAFDNTPEIARQIEAAEREDPAPGPFRIHRMSAWHPSRFLEPSRPDRMHALFGWYRDTLSPLEALTAGLEYCRVDGVINLDDYFRFFVPEFIPARAEAASALRISPGQPICYYPRRGFDLWGVRYFIVPVRTVGWKTEDRGFAAFRTKTEVVYPGRDQMDNHEKFERWAAREDWQILRNKAAYPRAWLVHSARVLAPVADPEAGSELMRDILYQDDLFWSEPERKVVDPRFLAWIETDDKDALRGTISRTAVEPGESVTVVRHEPLRVELQARLNRPGIVILADTYYPGWHLTIDGRPAPILRANRMMRGAAVREGEHTLVYVYDPLSFRIGAAVSLMGLAVLPAFLVAAGLWNRRNREETTAAPGPAYSV